MNTPHLLSPNGGQSFVVSPMMDAHETASNHSGHSSNNNNNNTGSSYHGSQLGSRHDNLDNQSEYSANVPASSTSVVAGQHEKLPAREKNLKTEYKSKFKPFSEYAYNEVTDSFVKCHHSAAECSSISAARSNQDLMSGGADTSGAHHHHQQQQQHQITISTHDADVFEPSQHADGSESHHAAAGGSVAEPWYKEVVKRNEKANEYRFKSEVGHNSPLLSYITRSDSPSTQLCAAGSSNNNETTPRQLASPSGNESVVSGACESNLYEIRSQHSDQQQQASCNDSQEHQQAAKAQYRFTPSSYRRDNLIAHMANNNNFNLPKEQQEAANIHQQQQQQPRRAATATSAQARARSQSSRRPQATTTTTNNSPRVQQSGASKSNHATPTKTMAPRANLSATRATNATSSKSHAKTVTPTSTVASRYATTTRTASSANGSGGLASSRFNTTSTMNKRTPTTAVSSTTASSRAMPKPTTSSRSSASPATSSVRKTLVSSTTSSAARPAPSLRPKTATQSRTPSAAAGSNRIESPAKTSAIKAGKLPVTSARGPPSSRAAPSSSSSSSAAAAKDKPAPATPESSSPVKSIKTRKAIESETAKAAAAAAAATAVVAAGVSAALATSSGDKIDQQLQQQSSAPAMESTNIQELRYAPEEQNLIFTTTEAGDMLADELAQAEMAQAAARYESTPVVNEAIENNKQNQVAAAEEEEESSQRAEKPEIDSSKQASELPSQDSQGELVNGLAGGLISAEDGFDSSERDYSSEANQLAAQQQELQNNTDEPYSIIPTAANSDAADDRSDQVILASPVSESDGSKHLEQEQQCLFEHNNDEQLSRNLSIDENRGGEIDGIDTDLPAESCRDEILMPDSMQNISKMILDDINSDEHLKLGSHPSNSDDELISKPGQLKYDDDESTPEPKQQQRSLIEDDDEPTTPIPQQQRQQSLIENDDESTPDSKQQQQDLSEDDDEQSSGNLLTEENRTGEIDGIDADLAADSGRDEILMPDVTQKISKINLDDIDSDEHLKLSSHLTNSDDELILKPGKLKSDDDESTTPTPKQQQQLDEFDAELMAKEDHVEWKSDLGDINSTSEAPPVTSSVETPEPEIASGEPMDGKQSDNISSNDLWTSSPVGGQQQAPAIKSEPIDMQEIVETAKRDEFSSEDEGAKVQMQNITSQPANLVDFSGFDLSDNSSNNTQPTAAAATTTTTTNNGLILNPSDLEGSSSRQLQASGVSDLDLMAQEDRLEGTFELSDGSSAALEIPTSIENRVEMSTSKASTGEELDIPQASFKFARKIRPDSDDEELDIDPDEDPIGSAATLSPNASVAEELMKFNAAMDNIGAIVEPDDLVDLNRHLSGEMTKQITDLSSPTADNHSRNNNDLEELSQQPAAAATADASDKDKSTEIEPVDGGNDDEDEVKSHVIGETIKQAAISD